MKKKVLSAVLVASMLAGMTAVPVFAEEAAEEGKVLNIYCWNEEFKSRLTDHYPGYEEVDGTHGKIGDVEVVWNITPSDDNAYQNNLDENLLKQADAAADDKIDLFLVEADYALKYVDTEYTMNVADLGITDEDLAQQFQYTQDIVTDSNGNLKGVSWQGCPGLLVYNRDVAKEVLGTDDPAEVQKSVADWDTFLATAQTMKDAGYFMTSSVNDAYRVFSNNVTSKWVEDGVINVDENIEVDMKHGVGQGVRAIVGSILKLYYLINQNSTIAIYDEKLSALSESYVPRYFEFLKRLCDERQISIILVCHDPRFFDYADKCYLVNDGNVRLVSKDDKIVLEEETSEE